MAPEEPAAGADDDVIGPFPGCLEGDLDPADRPVVGDEEIAAGVAERNAGARVLVRVFHRGFHELKGAVPILLASFVLEQGVRDARMIYELVFIVVLASVVVQGGTIGVAARRFGVRLDSSCAADADLAPPA